jgi:hypothetical protein
MRRNTLLIDAGIAAALAIFVLIVAPGLAVVGLLAILVVLVCAVSFGLDARRRKRSSGPPPPQPRRRVPPPRRSPPRR